MTTVEQDRELLPDWIRHRVTIVGDCLLWEGAMTGRDARQCRSWNPYTGRLTTVSRDAYEHSRRIRLHPSQIVFRSCWNPRCVRPAHLIVGERGEQRPPLRFSAGVAAYVR